MVNVAHSSIISKLIRLQCYPTQAGLNQVFNDIDQICSEHNFILPPALSRFMAAYQCERHGQTDLAIATFVECIALCTDEELLLQLHAHINLGSLSVEKNDFHASMRYFSHVIEHSHRLDDNSLSLVYTNFSDLHLYIKQYSDAILLAKKGIQASQTSHNHSNLMICQLNCGLAMAYLDQFDEAVLVLQDAMVNADICGSERNTALTHGYLARVLAMQSTVDHTIIYHHFNTADTIFTQITDQFNYIENCIYFAKYLADHDRDKEALKQCEKVIAIIDNKPMYATYSILWDVYHALLAKQQDKTHLVKSLQQQITCANQEIDVLREKESLGILKQREKLEVAQDHLIIDKMQEHLNIITEIGQQIATTTDITTCLEDIFIKINTLVSADEFGIALYDNKNNYLHYDYFVDKDGLMPSASIDCSQTKSVGGYAISNKKTVHLNTIDTAVLDDLLGGSSSLESGQNEYVIVDKDEPIQSIVITPIIIENKILGILSLQHHKQSQYHQYHCKLIEQLASFIAVSLENQKQRYALQQMNSKLDGLTRIDALTGLYNRYHLNHTETDFISALLDSTATLSVMMIDIDYYKSYNDLHGHQQGDLALVEISKLAQQQFNTTDDHLFRYGGDEFLFLHVNQTHAEIEHKYEHLQNELHQLNLINPDSQCSDRLTLTIGGQHFNSKQHTGANISFEQLLAIADEQLYKAKAQSRNTIMFCQ
ncbi:GGDEF domain-containing protein [Moritella marina ATCC 15381]|uniref:diguanylate cyclase n=1 Tax=Moritella marina ATCC 15381 TaxID=1202962 RepID=A0A5J6WJI4_MORMI|nr:sensor domain-containing diguanylate cyclase [Moritella marina]QFI38359.1 GGDEF domain-containing protein [Moritella marina ATCC 15381]